MKKHKESYSGAGCGVPPGSSVLGPGSSVPGRWVLGAGSSVRGAGCEVQGTWLNNRIAYFNPALG